MYNACAIHLHEDRQCGVVNAKHQKPGRKNAHIFIIYPQRGGGYFPEIRVGVCGPLLQTLTLFQTKNNYVIFPTLFQT